MQHNVVETALNAFSRVKIGHSSLTVSGLRVTPLIRQLSPGPPALQGALALSWAEADPPRPQWLRVRNSTPAAVTVPAGYVLVGGMSSRTVRMTTAVASHGWADVSVEPLEARWWNEGEPRWHGHLGPVARALLFQALLARVDVASSARTALWSLSLGDLVASADVWRLDPATAGWVLADEVGAVAAWLKKSRSAAPRPVFDLDDPRPAPQIEETLRSGIDSGMLAVHVLEHVRSGVEIAILPKGRELIDRVVASANSESSV
jgi:hypothetical protein